MSTLAPGTTKAAELIRAARGRARISQAELGRRAGVPQSMVSIYEAGRRDPSLTTLLRLLEAAGLSLDLSLTRSRRRFRGPVGRRLEETRVAVIAALERGGFTNPRVFGSVARGEDRPDSDVDLLVDFPDDVTLVSLGTMETELERIIGAKVDLVPERDLRARVRASVLPDTVPL